MIPTTRTIATPYPLLLLLLFLFQKHLLITGLSLPHVTLTPPPLLGQRALVTGASGGLGRGIAHALAAAGARVVIHYHTRREGAIESCRSIRLSPPLLLPSKSDQTTTTTTTFEQQPRCCDGIIQCDFRDPKAIERMFHTVVDDIWDGTIDILVNNAGVITKLAQDDDDDSLSSWHETMAVNLHAPLQLSRLAHQRMRDGKTGGNIIMVSSIHGSSSVEYMTSYAASKAALDALTRGLSSEWAPDDVRVNSIAPGIIPVERTVEALSDPKTRDMWMPHLPVGRMGTVEDIGDGVVYMCTAGWMSGSVLTLDGGMTARANMPFRARPEKQEVDDGRERGGDGLFEVID